jgi:pimeloyl-ACP methyl ester carboxylesterase
MKENQNIGIKEGDTRSTNQKHGLDIFPIGEKPRNAFKKSLNKVQENLKKSVQLKNNNILTKRMLENEFFQHALNGKGILGGIKCKTLIIQGKQDCISIENPRFIKNTIANAVLQTIPDRGHYPHLEQPKN